MAKIHSIEEIYQIITALPPKKIAVANAQDAHVLEAVEEARQAGYATAFLVGDPEKIAEVAGEEGIDLSNYDVCPAYTDLEALELATRLVRDLKADVLMKGKLQSADFFRAILNKEYGLRDNDAVLSILSLIDLKKRNQLTFLIDAALNPLPNLEMKQEFIEMSVSVLKMMGIQKPKVAVLSAAEKVNTKMASSVEAEELARRNREGIIRDCIVEGPLSFDLAMSKEAVAVKGYQGKIEGDADLIVVPSLEAGNMLYKSLILYTEMETAAIMLGTKAPVVFSSRADSASTKKNTIATAIYLAEAKKQNACE